MTECHKTEEGVEIKVEGDVIIRPSRDSIQYFVHSPRLAPRGPIQFAAGSSMEHLQGLGLRERGVPGFRSPILGLTMGFQDRLFGVLA